MTSRAKPRVPGPDSNCGLRGLVFDIKRFAVHDGPGIRTTVFLKGCTLACAWCHNPESIDTRPQLLVHPERCIGCRACVTACPHGAHSFVEDDPDGPRHVFDRDLCTVDGSCAEVCYAEALELAGHKDSVDDVLAVLLEDADFYKTSGGGITLSGGEPFLQRDFTEDLLRRCKDAGLHTAVDTSGQVPWTAIERSLPYIDLMLYDLKHMDAARHRQHTGASNELILENLRRVSDSGVPIEIRIPVIPSVNDDIECAQAMGRFMTSLKGVGAVRLLPYHRLAGSKYASVGRPNTMPVVDSPSTDQLVALARVMSAACCRSELPFLAGDQTIRFDPAGS